MYGGKETIPDVDLPAGRSGRWAVEHFTISEREAQLSAIMDRGRGVRPGRYTRLTRGGEVIMSDTRAEKRDHLGVVTYAGGRVLVTGLGLGMVTAALLQRSEVSSVTVVEESIDVILLVAPTLQRRFGLDRLRIVCADAFTWKPEPDDWWSCAWHDVWDAICGDNTKEMGRLRRHYSKRIGGWQWCWAEAECKRANRESRRWRY